MDHPDTCVNPQPSYYCPAVGEMESPCHGGFDTCCAEPVLHVDIPVGDLAIGQRLAQLQRVSLMNVGVLGEGIALLEQAWELINASATHGVPRMDWQIDKATFNKSYARFMEKAT